MKSSLEELLELFDDDAAGAFVRAQIGRLIDFDREHDSHLTDALEHALGELSALQDIGARRTQSPAATQARELLDVEPDDPDERLAVHLALKLHRRVGSESRRAGREPALASARSCPG